MSIEKMNLIQLTGSLDLLDAVLLSCCESRVFQMEAPPERTAEYGSLIRSQNPYSALLQQADALMEVLHIAPDDHAKAETITEESAKNYLESVRQLADEQQAVIDKLQDDLLLRRQAKEQLSHLRGLTVRIEDLSHSASITARFGRMPAANVPKLEHFEKQLFYFFDFDHDENFYWGVYLAPTSHIEEIDRLFRSLYFEQVELPNFLDETPEYCAQQLQKEIERLEQTLAAEEEKLQNCSQAHGKRLQGIYAAIKQHNALASLHKYVSITRREFFFEGFVPEKETEAFVARFADEPRVACDVLDPRYEPRLEVPVQLHTPKFFKPFELYVKMYGLPAYDGLDPTVLIGMIYILLFGIMFADVGQGLVLALGGAALYRLKKMDLAGIISRCGIASVFFGALFGSVFGFEELLDPMYEHLGIPFLPLKVFDADTTNLILFTVVGIGIAIILLAMILNILLSLKKKDYENGLFSNNGAAGLLCYGGVVLTIVLLLFFEVNVLNPVFLTVVVILPVFCMLMKEPLARLLEHKSMVPEGGFGGYLLQNGFELLEYAISYLSNTLSFLRVGGFVLSHAGMMLVVKTLAEMVGSGGNIAVWIFGNLFVMALEGFVVAIQVLRLVYYETFSRFYDPSGREYTPTTIENAETAVQG